MITCYILDDEPNCIEALKQLLVKYCPQVEVVGEATSAAEAFKFLSQEDQKVDILFLDIQMPKEDGFAFLNRFPKLDFSIIFTTAYDQYAIKAFKLSALDYLLKPVANDELINAVEKYVQKPGSGSYQLAEFKTTVKAGNPFEKLCIPTQTEILFMKIGEILYMESDNNYTSIHLSTKGKILSSKNIGYYEELLADLGFFRIHNSYLINLKMATKYIKGKSGYVEMENGVTLEISKRRKDQFLQLMQMK